ncbi:MAG: pantetheine-phosphate adenylyltransferase [Geodermatophilaceae bacterium]|nr:pantetheine-phosphate adenylyltransferase [Geodermatophilaceae bacterium]MDQ3456050.1 pantetheine-phosphate adenylyltransferase [Actinomycetota bacterium]
MRRAVCPGSFDPVTNGHLDVIERACRLYDELVVAVLVNDKKQGMFAVEERMRLLTAATAGRGNVVVDSFSGLLVDYCKDRGIDTVLKGLRATSDFDYELQMAQMNRELAGVETIFLPTNPEHSFLSSSLVKEVARFGGDISRFVPAEVAELITRRGQRNGG